MIPFPAAATMCAVIDEPETAVNADFDFGVLDLR